MRRVSAVALFLGQWLVAAGAFALPPLYGDVNGNQQVDAVDVQLVINAALGLPLEPDFQPDLNNDGAVNALDVQLVINAVLGIVGGPDGADVTARIYTEEGGPAEGALLRVFWRDFLLTQQTADASGEVRISVPADGAMLSFQASMPTALKEEYDPATHEALTNSLRVLQPTPNVAYSLNFMLYRELPFTAQRTTLDELNGTMRVHTPNHSVMVSDIPEELGIVGGSARTFSPANSPDAFPGEFATRESGEVDPLISAGFASVNLLREGPDGELEPVSELFDEEGEPVYVTLRFRLDRADWPAIQPGTLHSDLPGYVDDPMRIMQPVYFYDEIEGDWRLIDSFGWLEDQNGPVPPEFLPVIQEGEYPNDLYLVAEMRHFSFINLDYPLGLPGAPPNPDRVETLSCVTGVLVNEDGEPVKGAKITIRSMPANHQGLFFSNVITVKTNAAGQFGVSTVTPANVNDAVVLPRSERNANDDWNRNERIDSYYFSIMVEKKGLCGTDLFDSNGQGYRTSRSGVREGCLDVGTLEVNIVEAKVKSYYINFVDSVTGDPLFVPVYDGLDNYAQMFLKDPLIEIPSDTYSCACEETLCSYYGPLNESGQGFARIPIVDPKSEYPYHLNGRMMYRRDRPDFGPGGYEEADFGFLHRRDKSHYQPGETICSLDLDGAGMTPPVDTIATAHARFEMIPGGADLIIEHNVPGATGAFIREAAPGETGPIVFSIPAGEGGVFTRLFFAQELDFIANIPTYLVIESDAHPDGEVRGDFEFCAYTYKVPVTRRGAPTIEILSPEPDQTLLYDDPVLLEATGESVMLESIDPLDAFVWTRTGDLVVVANTRATTVPAWQAFGVGENLGLNVEAYDYYAYRGDAFIGGMTVLPVEIAIDTIPTTTIATSGTVQLGATVANANNTEVIWTSGNPAVATVNSEGVVTGNSPGTVSIVARSAVDPNTADTVSITVQALLPAFTVTPSSGTTDTVFAFDASGSDGDIAVFEWDFGDGNTAFGVAVNHVYAQPGEYAVTLTLEDPAGVRVTSSPTTVAVVAPDENIPPTAVFTVTPQSGNPPLEVAVDASASTDPDGDIVAYEWDFGDGGARSGIASAYVYEVPGTYVITLTVVDDRGATGTASASVRVNTPPVAAFSYTQTPATGEIPLQVDFNAAVSTDPDGQIVLYEWDFGDGTTQSGVDLVAPSHIYESAGVFEASLRVTDDDGATDTTSDTITAVGITAEFTIVSAALDFEAGGYRIVLDASASVSFPHALESYEWEFREDGSFWPFSFVTNEPTFSYLTTFTGPLEITLIVTNTEGETDEAVQTIELETPEGQFENVTPVNVSPGGTLLTNLLASPIDMSDDGRFIAFRTSSAPADQGYETTGGPWVYIKDMETGGLIQVPRVNPNPGQNPVNGLSLSGDGNRVAYRGLQDQIYVYDVALDEHYIASAPAGGGEEVGNGISRDPSISADGRFVAFQSSATNLVDDNTFGAFNIFVTDLEEDEVVRVGPGGRHPTITADGSKVVLQARRNDYIVTSFFHDELMLVDVADGSAVLITTNTNGSFDSEKTLQPETVSTINNGEWVVFTTRSEWLAPEVPDNGVPDIYLKNTETGVLAQLTDSDEFVECDDLPLAKNSETGGRAQPRDSDALAKFDLDPSQEPGGAGVGRFSENLRWLVYQPNGYMEECGQFGPFFRNLLLEDLDTGARANAAFDMWEVQGQLFREVVMTPDGRYIAFRYDNHIFRAENPFWEE